MLINFPFTPNKIVSLQNFSDDEYGSCSHVNIYRPICFNIKKALISYFAVMIPKYNSYKYYTESVHGKGYT